MSALDRLRKLAREAWCFWRGHELSEVAEPVSDFVERRRCVRCAGSFAHFLPSAALIGQPPGALYPWSDDVDAFYRRRRQRAAEAALARALEGEKS